MSHILDKTFVIYQHGKVKNYHMKQNQIWRADLEHVRAEGNWKI